MVSPETSLKDTVSGIITEIEMEVKPPDRVLPDPGLLSYYKLLRQRRLSLDDYIECSASDIWENILHWNIADQGLLREERTPITIYIMSDGGDSDSMWMLVDAIRASVTPVITVNIGMAASAAAMVFLVGSKRLMMPNAQVLLHEGSARISGDGSKVIDAANAYNRSLKRMQDIIIEHTKITKKIMNKHVKDDWYINAKQSLEYGICDKIIEGIEEII